MSFEKKPPKKSKFIKCPKCRTETPLSICPQCGKFLQSINIKKHVTKIREKNEEAV
jgi:hypothetical protein